MTYSIASLRLVLTLAAQAVGESAEPEPNEFLGRCLGVHRNAIEQEPFILATAIAAKCLGAAAGSRSPLSWHFTRRSADATSDTMAVLLNVITACRVLYSLSYLASLQPFRTIFFATALFAGLGLAILLCLA